MSEKDLKAMYRTRTEGEFPATFSVLGRDYEKVEDLRYGTNPHQPAAFYRPAGASGLVLGAYKMLKTGKSGLSQTTLEDKPHAIGILKYMERPTCAVMKHCNPSGVAIEHAGMPLVEIYQRARDADAQAAFGSVVAFNTEWTPIRPKRSCRPWWKASWRGLLERSKTSTTPTGQEKQNIGSCWPLL